MGFWKRFLSLFRPKTPERKIDQHTTKIKKIVGGGRAAGLRVVPADRKPDNGVSDEVFNRWMSRYVTGKEVPQFPPFRMTEQQSQIFMKTRQSLGVKCGKYG